MLGLLVAALLGADGGAPRAPGYRFEVPDMLSVVDIPGEQRALGVPMKLLAVRSRRSADQVRLSLLEQFQRAKLYIPPAAHVSEHETTIVGLDPAQLVAYSAVIKPHRDGTSTVVLGTSYLERAETPGLPPWGPVFPGATGVTTTDVELMQTAVYSVRAEEAEVRAFYDTVLPGAGFKQTGRDEYQAASERLTVTYSQKDGEPLHVMMVRQVGVSPDP